MGEGNVESQPFTITFDDLDIVYDFDGYRKSPGATTEFEHLQYLEEENAFVFADGQNRPHTPFTREQATAAVKSALEQRIADNFGLNDDPHNLSSTKLIDDATDDIVNARKSWTPVTNPSKIPGGPQEGYAYYRIPSGILVRVPDGVSPGSFEFVPEF